MIIADGKKMAGISYLAQSKACETPKDWSVEVMDALYLNPKLAETESVWVVDDVDEEIKYWENQAKEDTEGFNEEKEEEGWTKLENGCWRPADGGRCYSDEIPGFGWRVEYYVEDLKEDHAAQEEKFAKKGY